MAISQAILRTKATRYSEDSSSIPLTANYSSPFTKGLSAFLCHSHKDERLVKGLLVIFKEAGVNIYIDWKDHTMPNKPNKDTAEKIQKQIKKADIFLFLATANSKASRWCPWEIGYADSSNKNIYIVPTEDAEGCYGNEYLELYPNIDKGTYNKDGRIGYCLCQPNAKTGFAISNRNLQ